MLGFSAVVDPAVTADDDIRRIVRSSFPSWPAEADDTRFVVRSAGRFVRADALCPAGPNTLWYAPGELDVLPFKPVFSSIWYRDPDDGVVILRGLAEALPHMWIDNDWVLRPAAYFVGLLEENPGWDLRGDGTSHVG